MSSDTLHISVNSYQRAVHIMKNKILLFLVFLFNVSILSGCNDPNFANSSSADNIKVCFTPGGQCTNEVVDTINHARSNILVQAYSFTSAPIAQALVNAQRRHVQVKVILDKSQFTSKKYSSSQYLNNYHIPVWIDYKPAIAHNKIMIIDDRTVITGSFNFTKAAEYKNVENLLIIRDPILAGMYTKNWQSRLQNSQRLADYANYKKFRTAHAKKTNLKA